MPAAPSLTLALCLLPLLGMPQSSAEQAADDQTRPTAVAEPYQGGWQVPAMELKEETLEKVRRTAGYDASGRLEQLRWERNSSLARNAGQLSAAERARLVDLAVELNAMAPNSFEAHMANYYAQFPAPTAFDELERAVAQDGKREELIAPRLANAARKQDKAELTARAKDMELRGRMAPALYKVAEDIMASVEPGAILFAAGEMDAYPLWVEQYANGKHADLLVVDERLLVDPGYRSRIWGLAKARGPVPTEATFIPDLAGSTTRPVYISLALGSKALAPLKDRLYVTGLAMRLSNEGMDNIPVLEARWDRLKKPLDAGPLSRNYLVPGAVLLTHYRTIGDEARASRLEHELRQMAERLGAKSTLEKSGILQH